MIEIYHNCNDWRRLIDILQNGIRSRGQLLKDGKTEYCKRNMSYVQTRPNYDNTIYFGLEIDGNAPWGAPWISLLIDENKAFVAPSEADENYEDEKMPYKDFIKKARKNRWNLREYEVPITRDIIEPANFHRVKAVDESDLERSIMGIVPREMIERYYWRNNLPEGTEKERIASARKCYEMFKEEYNALFKQFNLVKPQDLQFSIA
jgi:hypothetical protein